MQNGDNTKKRPSFLIFLGLGDGPELRVIELLIQTCYFAIASIVPIMRLQ